MRILIWIVVALICLLLPRTIAAQDSTTAVSGPALGLVADRAAGTIRPILGIPGAATWGAPLTVDFATAQMNVAPGADFALAVAKENFRLAIVRAAGGPAEWIALEPPSGAPDLVAFSPRGRAAAIYYREAGRLVVVSGLRDAAAQVAEVDITSLPGAANLLAVSEDGSSLLAAVAEGERAAVYYLSTVKTEQPARISPAFPGDEPTTFEEPPATPPSRRLTTFTTVSALEFAGESLDALVADSAANAVHLMKDASGAASILTLGAEGDGLASPTLVRALDARRVLVANAAGKFTILYRDGTSPLSIQCDCSPAGLSPLASGMVFRLAEPSGDPLLLLDASGVEPRLVVVPPDRTPADASTSKEGGAQ